MRLMLVQKSPHIAQQLVIRMTERATAAIPANDTQTPVNKWPERVDVNDVNFISQVSWIKPIRRGQETFALLTIITHLQNHENEDGGVAVQDVSEMSTKGKKLMIVSQYEVRISIFDHFSCIQIYKKYSLEFTPENGGRFVFKSQSTTVRKILEFWLHVTHSFVEILFKSDVPKRGVRLCDNMHKPSCNYTFYFISTHFFQLRLNVLSKIQFLRLKCA